MFSVCFAALGLSVAATARADVKLPAVIDSHMVLQRDRPLPIWGWAEPGEEVTITLDTQKASAKADDKGHWKVTLKPVQAVRRPFVPRLCLNKHCRRGSPSAPI
jgi:sialate O-acetylesterase